MKNEIVFSIGLLSRSFLLQIKKAGQYAPPLLIILLPQKSRNSQHKFPCVSCFPWFIHYFRK